MFDKGAFFQLRTAKADTKDCDYHSSSGTTEEANFRKPSLWDTLSVGRVSDSALKQDDDQDHNKILGILLPHAF
jgi:hypothetical protein